MSVYGFSLYTFCFALFFVCLLTTTVFLYVSSLNIIDKLCHFFFFVLLPFAHKIQYQRSGFSFLFTTNSTILFCVVFIISLLIRIMFCLVAIIIMTFLYFRGMMVYFEGADFTFLHVTQKYSFLIAILTLFLKQSCDQFFSFQNVCFRVSFFLQMISFSTTRVYDE